MSTESAALRDKDEEEIRFEKAVSGIVDRIEHELRTHGDDEEDTNKLKNVEFRIQAARILNCLEMCIKKTEIAFCLPFMLKNPRCICPAAATVDIKTMKSVLKTFATFATDADETIVTMRYIQKMENK